MATLLQSIILVFELGLFIYVICSWILPPYHSFRLTLGKIFDPILEPIRRLVPPVAGLDFSVIILFILISVLQQFLVSVLR
jgi:YggT family protein